MSDLNRMAKGAICDPRPVRGSRSNSRAQPISRTPARARVLPIAIEGRDHKGDEMSRRLRTQRYKHDRAPHIRARRARPIKFKLYRWTRGSAAVGSNQRTVHTHFLAMRAGSRRRKEDTRTRGGTETKTTICGLFPRVPDP